MADRVSPRNNKARHTTTTFTLIKILHRARLIVKGIVPKYVGRSLCRKICMWKCYSLYSVIHDIPITLFLVIIKFIVMVNYTQSRTIILVTISYA